MSEVLTYEALKEKCDRLDQISAQTLRVKMTMADVIKVLTDQVNGMAVENAALKKFGDKLNEMHNDLNGEGTGIQGRAEVLCQQAAIEAAMDEFDAITTPATDSALAAIQAQGVEKLIKLKMEQLASMHPDTHAFGATAESLRAQINEFQAFASTLREAK